MAEIIDDRHLPYTYVYPYVSIFLSVRLCNYSAGVWVWSQPSMEVDFFNQRTNSTQATKLDLPRMHFSPPGDVRLDHTNFFFDMAGDGSYIFDDVTDSTHFSGGAAIGSGC